jgi:anti-sigma B factor antagonist
MLVFSEDALSAIRKRERCGLVVVRKEGHGLTGTSQTPGSDGVPPPQFEIGIAHRDGSLLVSISGEFDLGATPEFERVVSELTGGGLRAVEIDLRRVTFIDSTGLRMLVDVERVARERELPLRIVRGGSAVERVLQLTGLDQVLPLVDE